MLACCVKDRGSSCGRASMRLYPRASFLAYGSSARCAGRRTLSFFTVAKEENDESDEDENEDEDEDEDEELGRNKGRSAERGIVTQQSNEASPDGRFRGRWLLLTLGARYCPWLVNRHRQKKKQMQKKTGGNGYGRLHWKRDGTSKQIGMPCLSLLNIHSKNFEFLLHKTKQQKKI